MTTVCPARHVSTVHVVMNLQRGGGRQCGSLEGHDPIFSCAPRQERHTVTAAVVLKCHQQYYLHHVDRQKMKVLNHLFLEQKDDAEVISGT